MISLALLILGGILTACGFVALRKLDPPRKPGESRFEGVLPNRSGLWIFVAYLSLIFGLILVVMGIAGFFLA